MARGIPLASDVIEQIRQLATAGKSRDGIARELGVSRRSVDKYAPPGSFDRTATAAAVKARQVDMASRRAELAANLLADAERLRAQMWQPAVVFAFGGRDNDYNEHPVGEPPAGDKRTLIQAATTAVTAHLRLVDHDSDGGLDEARSVLDGFMDAVARRAAELAE